MTLTSEQQKACLAAIMADPETAAILTAELVPKKNPGGRPKGSKNRGVCKRCGCKGRLANSPPWAAKPDECRCEEPLAIVDRLDKAVDALAMRRKKMTLEQRQESDRRVARYMRRGYFASMREAMKLTWRELRRFLIHNGYLAEEIDVVLAYKQSEQRPGWGRVRTFKTGPAIIGAGYEEPVIKDEPTEKEEAGEVKPQKPNKPKRSKGYVTVPEEIASEPMPLFLREEGGFKLWGVDVSNAVRDEDEQPGYEEPIRARSSSRRWLAPVNTTAPYELGRGKRRRTVVGAGDGSNGMAPIFEWKPTIGECRQAALDSNPVWQGLPYEPDGRGRESRLHLLSSGPDAAESTTWRISPWTA